MNNTNHFPVATTVEALDAQLVRIAALVPELVHGYDGPCDAFVVLSRGARMVAEGKDPSDVANAMHDALLALGCKLEGGRDSQEY